MNVTVRSAAAVISVLLLALLAAGCEDTTPTPAEREAVETAVRSYLDALAEAYSTLDVSPLEGLASPNEIQTVEKLLRTLALSGNDRVDSELIGFDVETMIVFRRINATVRLIEVWDVTRYNLTTGQVKGRNPSSLQNTVLQLRRIEGAWLVIGRTVTLQDVAEDPPAEDTGGEGEESG